MRRTLSLALVFFVLLLVVALIPAQTGPATFNIDISASYQFHTLNKPTGLTVGQSTAVFYIVDSDNFVIRAFQPSNGSLTVVAGTVGAAGFADGTATSARFNHPTGISGGLFCIPNQFAPPPGCFQSTRLYVNDTDNFAIRYICLGFNCPGYCPNLTLRPQPMLQRNGPKACFRTPPALTTTHVRGASWLLRSLPAGSVRACSG